ncbi:hypothetical protein VIBNISOn1_1840039 [Vibrio nigripulchritudo SOn1]|uniref:Uncharacterized protein n=1 Tax=Vibrio nigripulchritudo SOn1 TaxID=1238450 RepID=A0AAV2VPQ7_9VIBR|nr:hypothetical protein [Vibrio nigripulchritudo]CCO46656.1 hypothetical protein VIBNISOn1_1840039 [Vibrio nigripulchritudo SOn1]
MKDSALSHEEIEYLIYSLKEYGNTSRISDWDSIAPKLAKEHPELANAIQAKADAEERFTAALKNFEENTASNRL